MADLDVTVDGVADTVQTLIDLGITDPERRATGGEYGAS